MRRTNGSRMVHCAGYLSVTCDRHGNASEISALYEELAIECVATHVNRVILKAIDCSDEGHRALRNAFTTLILTGIPAEFRFALVTNVSRIRVLFLDLQRDLWRLGIYAAHFIDEAQALEWLQAKDAPRPPPPSANRAQRAA